MLTAAIPEAYKTNGPRLEAVRPGFVALLALELGRRDGTLAPAVSIRPPHPSSQAPGQRGLVVGLRCGASDAT
jgi:hypothetical protein